jgi:hypothetical protein
VANLPPVANPDAYRVEHDQLLRVSAPGVLGNDTDPDGLPLTAVLLGRPAHGTLFFSGSGSFAYVPDAGFVGTDVFSYYVTDGPKNSSPTTVTLTVADLPPQAQDDAYTAVGYQPLTVAAPGVLADDSDPDGDPMTAVLVAPPQHGTLLFHADGSFTYYPVYSGSGTIDHFTYYATDGHQLSSLATVTLQVADQMPFAGGDHYRVTHGQTLSVAAPGVLANDGSPYGLPLAAVLVSSPGHGTLSFQPAGSFTYVPNAGFVGDDQFTYYADNGAQQSGAATVFLRVTQAAPVAHNDRYRVEHDRPFAGAPEVLANDYEADGLPLSAQLLVGPAHGTLSLHADGSFSYVPDAGFLGLDWFTYAATDGALPSDEAAVLLNVADLPPVANPDTYSVGRDQTLTVSAPGVLANDTDPDGRPLTAVLLFGPAQGTLVLHADGSFTYVPRTGFAGTDRFTYYATDGPKNSSPTTVTLTVTDPPPVAADDLYQVATNQTLYVFAPGVLANDSSPAGAPLTALLVGYPLHGSVFLNANGSFAYRPYDWYPGFTDQFTYYAWDGYQTSNVATVFLRAAPQAPFAADDAYQYTPGQALDVPAPGVLGNDTSPTGQPLAAYLVAGPAHGTLTFNGDGSFTYVPDAGFAGTDQFTYSAGDGTQQSNTATVILSVYAVVQPGGGTGRGTSVPLSLPPESGSSRSSSLAGSLSAWPGEGVRGQSLTFDLRTFSPTASAPAAGYTYRVLWGDGTDEQTVSGRAASSVEHVYTASGSYTVRITAVDNATGASTVVTRPVTITAVALQRDPANPSRTALVVGGTTGDDTIVIHRADGGVTVTINGVTVGTFVPTGRLIVYGQSGDDQILVAGDVTLTTELYGGDGNDILQGGGGNNLLVGGAGNDVLIGGSGRDVMIGGFGENRLVGNPLADLMIAGTSPYESHAAALRMLLAEWAAADGVSNW